MTAVRKATPPPASLPVLYRAASVRAVEPPAEDPGARVAEIIWTTGARRSTWSWEEWGEIDEELDLGGCDLSRLNARAPFLRDHCATTEYVLGVVEPGSAVITGTEGRCRVRLSRRADLADLWRDIQDGVLGQISVGYSVEEYVVTREDGRRPLYRAARWTPLEASLVAIGADPGAQVARSATSAPRLYPVRWRSTAPTTKTAAPKGRQEKTRMTTKIRSMTEEQRASLRSILAEYGVAEDKLDAAVEACAALWPAETTTGEGEMTEAARALGTDDPSPAGLARAATAMRALLTAAQSQATEKGEDRFAADAARGLHRHLGAALARQLFDSARGLYDQETAKVKPLTGQAPPAAPVVARGIADSAVEDVAAEAAIKADTEARIKAGAAPAVARRAALLAHQTKTSGGVK